MKPRVLVLGAGFAGVSFCQSFPRGLAAITLIDRNNDDYYGLAVPAGVRNLMNDPILVPAPNLVSERVAALETSAPLPPFVHHVLPPAQP